ncbi:hypothetical protein [Brachybacterium sp. UNK5269]|uniref:hypothetical protein n=1 Tax=Brachybacterium sp. UNK5269 TaxID=3408576 RepID=UPI003BB20511
MATKRESSQQKYQELTRTWRGVSAVVAALLAAISGWYLLWPRRVDAPAPQCGSGTLDCIVTVSAPVDGVVLASLLLLTTMFTLMTFTGIALMPTPDGTSVAPVPKDVEEVLSIPDSATRIVTAAVGNPGAADLAATTTEPELRIDAPLILWNTMPEEDQRVLLAFAREHLHLNPSQVRQGIRELAVDGDGLQDAYYVRLQVGRRGTVLRLS